MRRGGARAGLLALALLAAAVVGVSGGRARAASDEAREMKRIENAEQAPGGEEETPHIHPKKLLFQLINFGALAFILIKFAGPAITKALEARHNQLKADLASASEAKAAAEARLAEQERRLAALEQEIGAMRAGIRQEAEAEKARLIQVAEERARRIQEETRFLLDQQTKQAEIDLRHEAARVAVDMAEQIVRRALNAGDQQRLVDSFVGDVAGAPAAPAAGGRRS